jgi:hypothetical protein
MAEGKWKMVDEKRKIYPSTCRRSLKDEDRSQPTLRFGW